MVGNKCRKRFWTEGEKKLLKRLYPVILARYLPESFPKRNKQTIIAKAREMGLPSAKLWQLNENRILKNHFEEYSKTELMKLLPRRSWPAIIAQGERLNLRRNRNVPRVKINENYFEKWSPEMAYILGFILADGCIIKGTYKGYSDSLRFGVQFKDKDILEKIKSELQADHKISLTKNAVHLTITSQKIVDSLKKFGISYRKSLREKIPIVPTKFTKDFIRGIIDGDGSPRIDKSNYPALSLCGGRETITFIRDHFFKIFKIHSKISRRTYSATAKNYLYDIAYRCNSAQTLINYLYDKAELYLDRKYKIALRCKEIKIKRRRNKDKLI